MSRTSKKKAPRLNPKPLTVTTLLGQVRHYESRYACMMDLGIGLPSLQRYLKNGKSVAGRYAGWTFVEHGKTNA